MRKAWMLTAVLLLFICGAAAADGGGSSTVFAASSVDPRIRRFEALLARQAVVEGEIKRAEAGLARMRDAGGKAALEARLKELRAERRRLFIAQRLLAKRLRLSGVSATVINSSRRGR